MPNDCWNHITIVCKNKKYADQITDIVYNELKHEEGDKYVYNKNVNMIRRGTRGLEFKVWSAWRPHFEWLNVLLDRYPNCWVKNEWWEEGGLAGVCIGYIADNGEKKVENFEWEDLSIDCKHHLFILEDV